MKFGILYNIDYRPEVHGTSSSYYAQILDEVQLLEELGFDSAWFGEHHYAGYSFGAPAVIATAAAARTSRLRLGTGVSLIPLHHPLLLAEEYAMLDVLSSGRLEYGIGRGFLNYAYQLMGVDRAQSFERFREGTNIIIKAWTAREPFSFAGKFWPLDDYRLLFPTPVQKPHPPIYGAGAMSQESYIFAGSRGLHLCTGPFSFPTRRASAPISRFIARPSPTMVMTPRSATSPASFRCTAASPGPSRCAMAAHSRSTTSSSSAGSSAGLSPSPATSVTGPSNFTMTTVWFCSAIPTT